MGIFLIGGALWALSNLLPLQRSGYPDPAYDLFSNVKSASLLVFAVVPFVKTMRSSIKAHIIELSGSFGRADVLVTLDEGYAKSIVAAIEKARKGPTSTMTTSTDTPA